ncbi:MULTISPECIES: TetR/AcrR family transcriptional regulator [Streptomyces]|uniref:TetR family transcriptional regulator n=1 Tax=Streptomyces venezuelae TaxID=54571 RepID=A0A5P2BGA0_STRVZ|nr:TetR/AcrR family transcriptional regulator [Streptomyces venezuelae]MYY84239.1 TetR family transcriptional regulator [Streptomyces sp. SID335]MYZ19045.1 TetR family transcriptional regulator [Streptomyces sp. SID337]NDZ84558.1 TetR/AcrR family transcriptional regulator [Streptomyces sp. SID10115]NEA04294.1 TetR/AcrR family transcriptional regulator [Streptomyces sp. SID10116]NEB50505.1 TetR/AcrR family transcriptional regulator [Streptomyces sp. SID339]
MSAAKDPAKSLETRTKLLEGALRTLTEQGIAKTSARNIAATAGVNQALVFYHFGSVDELLAAACRHGTEQRVSRYRERLSGIDSLSGLLAFGREMHEEEREAGHVAVLGQLLAGSQTQPTLAAATAAGLALWIEEIEKVLTRVLSASPLGEFVDAVGLARAVGASFVGMELYEGVDAAGAERALDSLESLSLLVSAVEDLGPLAQRAVRHRLRRLR